MTGERDLAVAAKDEATGKLADFTAQVSDLTAKLEASSAELKQAQARLASPSAEAAAICSAAGVDALRIKPGATASGSDQKTREQLFAEAVAISDPVARAKFIKENGL